MICAGCGIEFQPKQSRQKFHDHLRKVSPHGIRAGMDVFA